MPTRTAITGFAVVLTAALATGCGKSSTTEPDKSIGPTGTPAQATTTTGVAPVFDPPKAFSDDRIFITHDENALVRAELAYTSMAEGQDTSGHRDPTLTIHAISLRDGRERWQAPTPIRTGMRLGVDNSFFRLTDGPGPPRLVWAGIQRTDGSGTQQDRFELVAGAFDASTGEQVWSTKKPFEGDAPEEVSVQVVGANDTHAAITLLRVGEEDAGAVVDARSGAITDTPPGFTPVGLDAGVVVGLRTTESSGTVAQGLDVASGQVRWTGNTRVDDLKATVVTEGVAQFTEFAVFDSRTFLVSTSDGAVRSTLTGRQDCSPATADVLVCVAPDRVEAVEVTGKSLWSLPDEATGRVMPHVTAVYSGLVYALASSGVILNAHTGENLVTDIEWTPDDVVPGYGIERDQLDGLSARRATA
jgi:outer membrane protein assembly factor BamB